MSEEALVVFVTAPDHETAARIGRTLVEEGLAACANVLPQIRSIYRWQGEINDEGETLMVLKTTRGVQERLTQRILQIHPYDTPEVVALPIVAGSADYLRWVTDQVLPKKGA